MNLKAWVCLLVLFISFSSCTIKKRSYTKGYYVDWAFHKSKTSSEKAIVKLDKSDKLIKKEATVEPTTSEEAEVKQNEFEANILAFKTNEPNVKKRGIYKLDEPCGDLITNEEWR